MVEIQSQGESILVDLLLLCWQEHPEGLQREKAQGQVH